MLLTFTLLTFMPTDVVEFLLESEPIDCSKWKGEEKADSAIEEEEGVAESLLYLLGCARDRRRIGNTPVCRYRLTWPHRANLFHGVVTNGEDKVELGSVGFRKFVPTLAPEIVRRNVCDLKLF